MLGKEKDIFMIKRNGSTILILIVCVVFGSLMFLLSMRFYKEYQCVKKHFPEKFIQVELVPEDESDIHKNVLDKGKAIYDRTYIVGNIRYRTEITSKEFDDNFYICEDNPREVYSEYDMEHIGKQLVCVVIFSGLGVMIFCGWIAAMVVILFKR